MSAIKLNESHQEDWKPLENHFSERELSSKIFCSNSILIRAR